jgi:hypothetical protein
VSFSMALWKEGSNRQKLPLGVREEEVCQPIDASGSNLLSQGDPPATNFQNLKFTAPRTRIV